MLYFDSSPERVYIFCKKRRRKRKGMIHSVLQRRRKISYKLSCMEDFEVNVEISEENILFKLKCTRKESKESHAPSQGFLHTDLYETGPVYFKKCFLTVKVIFFHSAMAIHPFSGRKQCYPAHS
jgi:hypothetical protein